MYLAFKYKLDKIFMAFSNSVLDYRKLKPRLLTAKTLYLNFEVYEV